MWLMATGLSKLHGWRSLLWRGHPSCLFFVSVQNLVLYQSFFKYLIIIVCLSNRFLGLEAKVTQDSFILDATKGFYCLRWPEHRVAARGVSKCPGEGKGRPQVLLKLFLDSISCFHGFSLEPQCIAIGETWGLAHFGELSFFVYAFLYIYLLLIFFGLGEGVFLSIPYHPMPQVSVAKSTISKIRQLYHPHNLR